VGIGSGRANKEFISAFIEIVLPFPGRPWRIIETGRRMC